MSKTPFEGSSDGGDDLLAEYHLDYKKAKPNRFAVRDGTHESVGLVV